MAKIKTKRGMWRKPRKIGKVYKYSQGGAIKPTEVAAHKLDHSYAITCGNQVSSSPSPRFPVETDFWHNPIAVSPIHITQRTEFDVSTPAENENIFIAPPITVKAESPCLETSILPVETGFMHTPSDIYPIHITRQTEFDVSSPAEKDNIFIDSPITIKTESSCLETSIWSGLLLSPGVVDPTLTNDRLEGLDHISPDSELRNDTTINNTSSVIEGYILPSDSDLSTPLSVDTFSPFNTISDFSSSWSQASCSSNVLTLLIPPTAEDISLLVYEELRNLLKKNELPASWVYIHSCKYIKLLKLSTEQSVVQMTVTITPKWNINISVHNHILSHSHDFWKTITTSLPHVSAKAGFEQIIKILSRLDSFNICWGNTESQYVNLDCVGYSITKARENNLVAYREGDFGEVDVSDERHDATVRSVSCSFLTKLLRCSSCSTVRRSLYHKLYKSDEKGTGPVEPHRNMPFVCMTPAQLVERVKQGNQKVRSLTAQVQRLQGKLGVICEREEPSQNCVCLQTDEISVKSELVFDPKTGNTIGYKKLANVTNEFNNLETLCKEEDGRCKCF